MVNIGRLDFALPLSRAIDIRVHRNWLISD